MSALATRMYPAGIRATGLGWSATLGRCGSLVGPLVVGALLAAGVTSGSIFFLAVVPALVVAIAVFFLVLRVNVGFRQSAAEPAVAATEPQTSG